MDKDNIKRWLKDQNKVILTAVIVLAIILRLYLYFQTVDQPLWWDEAQYMAEAKAIGLGIPYDLDPIRPPAFQWIGALFFVLGIPDYIFKFFFVLLPSIALVYLFYLLGKEMFSEKVGLISAFLCAISWTLLFWTNRYQPDFLSMCFQVLAIIFFTRFWKNNRSKDIIYSGIFTAIAFYFKVSALLVPMTFIVWIIVRDGYKAVTNKNYYYYALAFLASLIPYFIWAKVKFNNFLAFIGGYSGAADAVKPFRWEVLYIFNNGSMILSFDDLTNVLTAILFVLAIIYALRYLLGIDMMLKNKNIRANNEILSILAILVVAAFYIFYIREIIEDRWVFLWLPFMFMLIGNMLMSIKFNGKSVKYLGWIILALMLIAGYVEVSHGNELTKGKAESYLPVKEAGLWLKENSNPEDLVMSNSVPQNSYYSERRTRTLDPIESGSEFEDYLDENHPKYMIYSGYERYDAWIAEWISKNINGKITLKEAYADPQSTSQQPSLYLFEIKY